MGLAGAPGLIAAHGHQTNPESPCDKAGAFRYLAVTHRRVPDTAAATTRPPADADGDLIVISIVTVMRWSKIRPTQAITAGATLVAAGVIAAVVGATAGDPQATIALPPLGAAVTTGGIATLITGTNERATQTS